MPIVEPHKRTTASRWARYRPAAATLPSPAGLEVRPVESGDCAAVAAIEVARDGGDADVARLRCEAQVADPETLLLVALVDGRAVGFGRAGRLRRPSDAAPDAIPDGWYLLGVVVVDAWRRRGIGRAITERRLAWIAGRSGSGWYFANAGNRASLDLHRAVGFVEVTRRFSAPGITFDGGEGVLCRIDLADVAEGDRPE